METHKEHNIIPSSFPQSKQSQFLPFHSKFEGVSATYLIAPDQSHNDTSNSFGKNNV